MANNWNELSLEEIKARINEIVFTMSELELKKFLAALEKWWKFNRGKREHSRENQSINALFMIGSDFFRDCITNISPGGLFIETKAPVAVGEAVTIAFRPSENTDNTIEVEGKIVRVKPNGFGVKFNEPLTVL